MRGRSGPRSNRPLIGEVTLAARDMRPRAATRDYQSMESGQAWILTNRIMSTIISPKGHTGYGVRAWAADTRPRSCPRSSQTRSASVRPHRASSRHPHPRPCSPLLRSGRGAGGEGRPWERTNGSRRCKPHRTTIQLLSATSRQPNHIPRQPRQRRRQPPFLHHRVATRMRHHFVRPVDRIPR
jgi:hypothetical protein